MANAWSHTNGGIAAAAEADGSRMGIEARASWDRQRAVVKQLQDIESLAGTRVRELRARVDERDVRVANLEEELRVRPTQRE
jgi:hypothetical protein